MAWRGWNSMLTKKSTSLTPRRTSSRGSPWPWARTAGPGFPSTIATASRLAMIRRPMAIPTSTSRTRREQADRPECLERRERHRRLRRGPDPADRPGSGYRGEWPGDEPLRRPWSCTHQPGYLPQTKAALLGLLDPDGTPVFEAPRRERSSTRWVAGGRNRIPVTHGRTDGLFTRIRA